MIKDQWRLVNGREMSRFAVEKTPFDAVSYPRNGKPLLPVIKDGYSAS